MKSNGAEVLNGLNSVSAALDAQQEAVDNFRSTLTALASEIEALAAGTAQYGEGLEYAHGESVALGDECRDFVGSSGFDTFS